MRKVWRDIADMNFLECDNKLVIYHSRFACPLLDHEADSCTRLRNGGAPLIPPRYLHLDLPKHVMRNVCRFILLWNHPSGVVELATVTNVPVLLFEMRCMFFFIVKTRLCALSERRTRSFFPFLSVSFSVEAAYIVHALPSQTVFNFLSQWHNKICHHISDIMEYILAGKDQQQTNQPNDQDGD